MLSQFLALTLGALSIVNAAPSFSHQQALGFCTAGDVPTAASSQVVPASGTYEIHSKALEGAAVRVYIPGQPLYVSRSTEDAMDYKLFELSAKDKNMISLKHVGLDSPISVDNDNWVSTSTSQEDYENFILEAASGNPGYFVIHSAVSRNLVWTLNSADGDVSQNIRMSTRVSGSKSQLFSFKVADTSAQVALEPFLGSEESLRPMRNCAVEPGVYRILDFMSNAAVRSNRMSQSIFTSREMESYPSETAQWEISYARNRRGTRYTIKSVAHDAYLGLTGSKNLVPTIFYRAAEFTFKPRRGDCADGVVIHMAGRRGGVWGLDFRNGAMTTPIQIQQDRSMFDDSQSFVLEADS